MCISNVKQSTTSSFINYMQSYEKNILRKFQTCENLQSFGLITKYSYNIQFPD